MDTKTGIRWQITAEYMEDIGTGKLARTTYEKPIEGPANCDPDAKLTTKFRLYDGDGVLCLEGKMSTDCEFEPLDDYGMPAWGCTELRFYGGGKWHTL